VAAEDRRYLAVFGSLTLAQAPVSSGAFRFVVAFGPKLPENVHTRLYAERDSAGGHSAGERMVPVRKPQA